MSVIKSIWFVLGIAIGLTLTILGATYLLLWGTGEKGIT